MFSRKISNDSDCSTNQQQSETRSKSCQQKRGCSSLVLRDDTINATELTCSLPANSATTTTIHSLPLKKVPTIKLRKIDNQNTQQKHYDFNAIAVVKLKRVWQDLPCPKKGKNLLTNGIIKNTKRMRFQTKTILLDDED